MIQINAGDYYRDIIYLLDDATMTLPDKYKRVRSLFYRLCKHLTSDDNIQYSNFFARLSALCADRLIDNKSLAAELQGLRIRLNKVESDTFQPTVSAIKTDLYLLARAVSTLLEEPLPGELDFLSATLHTSHIPFDYAMPESDIKRMRVSVVNIESGFFTALYDDMADRRDIRVAIPEGFTEEILRIGAQLNLVDVNMVDDIYIPRIIVYEPDFLLDISSIAECYRDYGHNPLNYFMSRLTPDTGSHYILLGNIANQFLDDIVNQTDKDPADYMRSMKKVFRNSPIAIASCDELNELNNRNAFFAATRAQFENINKIVNHQFAPNGIDKSKALIEPSFICEMLGIQGRLDFLLSDFSSFIELKSGKAKELYPSDEITHKENHYVQIMLYYAVLHYNFDVSPNDIKSYLLYSRYPVLYSMPPYMALIKDAVNLRNRIVAIEYDMQRNNSHEHTREILSQITADNLNEKGLAGNFWDRYLRRDIDLFTNSLKALSPVESDYFASLFTFITKEQYVSKVGDEDMDMKKGVTMLWNAAVYEKVEAGEMIINLTIKSHEYKDDTLNIRFSIPHTEELVIPNFRVGDSVLLYSRNDNTDNANNKQIFKATVVFIDTTDLILGMKFMQTNLSVLPETFAYAIERDYVDTSFASMFRSLAYFLRAPKDRKELLLSQRKPEVEEKYNFKLRLDSENDVERIVAKALRAKDYFLLVGPPGTGKTSYALRLMVEQLYADKSKNILLLAYTNKAVDEICKSLTSISDDFPFIRIGSAAACDPAYSSRLMKNVVRECDRRTQVIDTLSGYRIFVSTASAISYQMDLFKIKQFDVAIIDEATQILEPQILGILSACDPNNRPAIRKFILIGDYKQLPAVVQQSDKDAVVDSLLLRKIGFNSFKESVFERLFRYEKQCGRTDFSDILTRQGRMHPEVGEFASKYFYNDNLNPIPLSHQTEDLPEFKSTRGVIPTLMECMDCGNMNFIPDSDLVARLTEFISVRRLGFIPVMNVKRENSSKVNRSEAVMVALLIKLWLQQGFCSPDELAESIGIITPYRTQIAMIRHQLQVFDVPHALDITIDTVERFQGGQKDLIIYSCCMNDPFQLSFLSNTIWDDGKLIDRKLNVAMTRARKQMFIVGNPAILSRDTIYNELINFIKEKGGVFDLNG